MGLAVVEESLPLTGFKTSDGDFDFLDDRAVASEDALIKVLFFLFPVAGELRGNLGLIATYLRIQIFFELLKQILQVFPCTQDDQLDQVFFHTVLYQFFLIKVGHFNQNIGALFLLDRLLNEFA